MLLKKTNYTYLTVLKYLVFGLTCLIFNNLSPTIMPYSFSLLVCSVSNGLNPITCSVLYLCCFLIQGKSGFLLSGAIGCLLVCIVFYIYLKLKIKTKYQTILISAVGMVVFVLIGDTETTIPLEDLLSCGLVTTALTFVTQIFVTAVNYKGLKFKLSYGEFCSVGIIVVLFGLGVCNAFSPYVWKSIAVLLILLCSFAYKKGLSIIVSAILGLSLSIFYVNVSFTSIYLILGLVAVSIMPISRYLAGIGLILSDFVIELVFGIYGGYTLTEFITTLSGILVFFFIPTYFLKNLKEKLYVFREKQLSRVAINRNRLMLSNKLYALSGIFTEMNDAFLNFKKRSLDPEKAKELIVKQIKTSSCKDCVNFNRCTVVKTSNFSGLSKLVELGFAKGKLSLIDIPRELSEVCVHPNNLLYGLNKLLSDYRGYILENQNVDVGRTLVARQAQGVSEILRDLALESGQTLKYQSRLERILSDALFKNGFTVSEMLIYGEEEHTVVSVILTMEQFSEEKLTRVISKTLSCDFQLTDKSTISPDKCYLSFKKACEYDAVFGVAQAKKDGSKVSGDTHSVTRLFGDKFLVALSDGMGSGEDANKLSSISLSLIESFYKAGMNTNLILDTVNKLMSINTEDDFTAIDVSVIDLKKCTADFIKYGSPYGFIVGNNGIRIVESNSLPLGILEELKPSVCTTNLDNGDIVLLISDGIADAFSSINDLIEYLRSLTALNPQTLANDVLKKALEHAKGVKNDDMTALAVRIFKKPKKNVS